MSQEDQNGGGVRFSDFRPVGGLIYGIIAAGVGAAAVVGLFIVRVSPKNPDFPNWSDKATGKFLSWAFYNAHTVPLERTVAAAGRTQTETFSLLKMYPVGDTLVFHVIPAVLLFLAGYSIANRTRRRLSATSGAIAGASVLVGYGIAAVAGVFVLKVTQNPYTFQPALSKTVALMVVGYPVAFGGIGGFLKGI